MPAQARTYVGSGLFLGRCGALPVAYAAVAAGRLLRGRAEDAAHEHYLGGPITGR